MDKFYILKLAKRLNRFNFDEILTISEIEDEVILKEFLDELVNDEAIVEREGTYTFVKIIQTAAEIETLPESDFYKPVKNYAWEKFDNYDLYLNSTGQTRIRAEKNMRILELTHGLGGKELDNFIKELGKRRPELKTGRSTFIKIRSDFNKRGIAALIGRHGKNKGASCVGSSEYELFKRYYFSNKDLAPKAIVQKIQEDLTQQEGYEVWLPSHKTFVRRLEMDFTPKAIERLRYVEYSKDNKKSEPQNADLNFAKAGEEFFSDFKKQVPKDKYKFQYSFYKSHILPCFEDFTLKEINEKMLKEYRKFMHTKGFSISTVKVYSQLVRKIINFSNPNQMTKRSNRNNVDALRTLNKLEIQRLLNTVKLDQRMFLIIYLAFSTGISLSEIFGLMWKFVDFDNKSILIKNNLYNGEIIKHRSNNKVRKVFMDEKLCKLLANFKKSSEDEFVFGEKIFEKDFLKRFIKERFEPLARKANLADVEFLDLKHTCISLLIKKNVPLNYIRKTFGFQSLDEMYQTYKAFFNEIDEHSYNILEFVKI